MTSKLWDRNNPLFLYGNEEKLNDLLTRALGAVVTEVQESQTKGTKLQTKLMAKLGSLLAALGIGEVGGELSTETSAEKVRTEIANIGFQKKLNTLLNYCAQFEAFPYVDTVNGQLLDRQSGTLVPDWKGRAVTPDDQHDCIGTLLGLFKARRILPPHNDTANIAVEFQKQEKNLWLFSSLDDSAIHAEVPVLLSNARLTSQHAILAFVKAMQSNFKIEAYGLLTWNNGTVTCDPVGWRLFY